jgi:hypothetical protein
MQHEQHRAAADTHTTSGTAETHHEQHRRRQLSRRTSSARLPRRTTTSSTAVCELAAIYGNWQLTGGSASRRGRCLAAWSADELTCEICAVRQYELN